MPYIATMKCELFGSLNGFVNADGTPDFRVFDLAMSFFAVGRSEPIVYAQVDPEHKTEKFFADRFPNHPKLKITIETIE